MKTSFFIFRIILYTFIFVGIFNSSHSKVFEFNYDAKSISNYFSGLIYFDDLDYARSEKFFKKLDNFEEKSTKYSSKFIHSLINLGKYNEAYKYSKKLEKKNISRDLFFSCAPRLLPLRATGDPQKIGDVLG